MRHIQIHVTIVLLLMSAPSVSAQTVPTHEPDAIAKGEMLFRAHCAVCHRIQEGEQKWIGPALGGYETRVPSIAWTVAFIQNSGKMLADGDAYAQKIFNDYNQLMMPAYDGMTEKEILAILAYIEDANKKSKRKD